MLICFNFFSQDELKAMEEIKAKQDKDLIKESKKPPESQKGLSKSPVKVSLFSISLNLFLF